jgi:hypothetical protein
MVDSSAATSCDRRGKDRLDRMSDRFLNFGPALPRCLSITWTGVAHRGLLMVALACSLARRLAAPMQRGQRFTLACRLNTMISARRPRIIDTHPTTEGDRAAQR